jgi:uncharacterized protein (TIGR00255 family)
MIKSMTGFSKVDLEFKEGKLYGEARALNNRYLEISLKIPKIEYTSEQKMRDLAKRHVKRGKVDIIVKWEKSTGELSTPKLNEIAVRQYLDVLKSLKANFGLQGKPTIENVLTFRDIITYEESNGISEEKLLTFFKNLLRKLDEERSKEGALIEKDLIGRLKKIRHNLKEIEKRWPLIIKKHEGKLREKILEVIKTATIDEVRVLQELAIYMEKLDIAEEVIRLKGHMDNFTSTMNSDEPIGRKLDFIIQEMVRETNTIGSKSNDLYINERVVQIKVDIEKMREQAQNVE